MVFDPKTIKFEFVFRWARRMEEEEEEEEEKADGTILATLLV
jgi:hypothetical protein